MYCQKCGKKIPDDAEFCMSCGTKVGDVGKSKDSEDKNKNKSKKNVSEYIKKNKKKGIIIGLIVAVVLVGIVTAIVFAIINSGKVQSYNEGVQYIASNNIKEAEESFEKAIGYKDANIYYSSVKAANQLYNKGNPGDALSSVSDMLDEGNVVEEIVDYKDRESSKLAIYMIGEVFYANNNLVESDKYFSLIPLKVSFFGHSVYERRATIAILGSWQSVFVIGGTHYDNGVAKFESNGAYAVAHVVGALGDGLGTWCVDLNYDYSDGSYGYICDKGTNIQGPATIKGGVLTIGMSTGSNYVFATKL